MLELANKSSEFTSRNEYSLLCENVCFDFRRIIAVTASSWCGCVGCDHRLFFGDARRKIDLLFVSMKKNSGNLRIAFAVAEATFYADIMQQNTFWLLLLNYSRLWNSHYTWAARQTGSRWAFLISQAWNRKKGQKNNKLSDNPCLSAAPSKDVI